ncbi:uncharacterized protein CCOS01_08456 [Colletotrichum costaricense]|uniref:Uncharacterized protein n=1 Tax=Colletotrichum costaricense TaxID=1209916 RepID=A0AAI9YWK7_9PEZI|nr:uncharacterized protein CCOS01_08456 [Colletotrichum costaricense]KAK1526038.1 hypothetical protein CCOS01_08456 [Colletotrichum costaricense]
MSFLGDMVDVLGDGAEDAGADAGEAGEAGAESVGSASEVLDSIDIGGDTGDITEGSGNIEGDVKDGMEESQNEMKQVTKELEDGAPDAEENAAALESKWATKFKNVWASAKTFGSFVGVELAKGALFTAGTKILQMAFDKAAAAPGSNNTDTAQITNIISTVNKSGKTLQDALDTWSKWQAAHYDNRASYGTISAAGFDIQLFQILQNDVSSLGDQRDKMVPLVKTAQQAQTLDSVQALLTADIAYAQAVVDLSNQISTKMTSMTDDGLKAKSVEVQAAYSNLTALSS